MPPQQGAPRSHARRHLLRGRAHEPVEQPDARDAPALLQALRAVVHARARHRQAHDSQPSVGVERRRRAGNVVGGVRDERRFRLGRFVFGVRRRRRRRRAGRRLGAGGSRPKRRRAWRHAHVRPRVQTLLLLLLFLLLFLFLLLLFLVGEKTKERAVRRAARVPTARVPRARLRPPRRVPPVRGGGRRGRVGSGGGPPVGVHREEPGEVRAGAAQLCRVDVRGVAIDPLLLALRWTISGKGIRVLRRRGRRSRRGVPRAEAGDVFPVADAGRRRVFVRRGVFKIGDEIGSNGGGGCSNRVGLVVARAGLRRAPVQQLARGVPPRGRRGRDAREAAVVPVESLRSPRLRRGDWNLDQVHLCFARDSPRRAKPGEHAPVSGVPVGVFGARDVRRGVELRRHRGDFDFRGYGVLPRRKSARRRVERSVEQHVQQRRGGAAQLASVQRGRR
mmetsp:Transcript_11073/g.50185  ORF Transcript_11073/g.50185 Transcript_11073/m.50185 type:complete len:447 (-) Transcript_11073:1299-2639(-)